MDAIFECIKLYYFILVYLSACNKNYTHNTFFYEYFPHMITFFYYLLGYKSVQEMKKIVASS